MTLERDVPDAVERRGLAVTMRFRAGGKEQLLFDPQTFALIGERAGDVSDRFASATLRLAVVEEPGQLPK